MNPHGLGARILLTLAAAAIAGPALAADEPPKADGLWRGNAGASLAVTSGNTRSTAVQLKADLARLTEVDKISLGGNIHYARSEVDGTDTTAANKLGAFGQYDWNLGPRLFAFGRLALDRDEVTDLDLRSALGAGLGWKLVDTKPLRISLYGGAGYTVDRYAVAQTIGGDTGTRFERASLLLAEESVHELSSSLNFKQRLELSPGVSGDRATLLKFTADVGVAINRTMSLTVGVVNVYDSKPPAGQEKNDFSLFTGLNVRLGAS